MKPVFETTGTCLNIKLPEELDHPASELIRRESDRIMGKIYIRTICFDFLDDGTPKKVVLYPNAECQVLDNSKQFYKHCK